MTLSRIILTTRGDRHSPIRTKWLTKIFVGGDVLCFAIQGGGGGLLSSADSQDDVNLGENVILGGLILQIIIFAIFLVVAGVYHVRARRAAPTVHSADIPWEKYLLVLYTVSLLIALRNVFRVIEYAMGSDGYLLAHEWTLYVFDGTLMVVVLVGCLIWYKANLTSKRAAMRDVEQLSSAEEMK